MQGLDPVFAWVIQLALALLFGAAALHKLRDLRSFSALLGNYRVLPHAVVAPAAAGLAICELGVAALLLLPAEALAPLLGPALELTLGAIGPLGALGLLSLYSAALALNLARGRRDLACGCFGPLHRQLISPGLLARNAIVALGPLLLLSEGAARAMSWIDTLSVIGATAMLVLLWNAAHMLAAPGPASLAPESTP